MIRIPLNRIMVGGFPPSGMKMEVVGLWLCKFRWTMEPCDPPIQVTVEGDYFRVSDGRHRFVAALMSGRTEIDAEIVS